MGSAANGLGFLTRQAAMIGVAFPIVQSVVKRIDGIKVLTALRNLE